MKAKPKYKIPFTKWKELNGPDYVAMMEWTSAKEGEVSDAEYHGYSPREWRDNVEFDATLRIVSWGRGRSSVRVHVKNEVNGERYSFGLGGFYDAVVMFGSKDGRIKGRWTFRKQGSNYILIPVLP